MKTEKFTGRNKDLRRPLNLFSVTIFWLKIYLMDIPETCCTD